MSVVFTLFPKHSFAHDMSGIVVIVIVAPLLIICTNLGKYLYLKSNRKLKLSFISFVSVAITELLLIHFGPFTLGLILLLLSLISGNKLPTIFEFSEFLGLFAMVLVYGVMAIFPNLFLLREKDQTVFNVLRSHTKVFRATILAFIFPTISGILIFIVVT